MRHVAFGWCRKKIVPLLIQDWEKNRPKGFRLVDVQGGAAYSAFFEGLRQGLFVHQAPPRRVHQKGALTHLQADKRNLSMRQQTKFIEMSNKKCVPPKKL